MLHKTFFTTAAVSLLLASSHDFAVSDAEFNELESRFENVEDGTGKKTVASMYTAGGFLENSVLT